MRRPSERAKAAMKAVAKRGCDPYNSHSSYVVEYQSKWKADVRRHNAWLARQHERLHSEYDANRELFV